MADRVFKSLGSHGNTNREEHDFYASPPIAVEELLKRESFPGLIWEPACGDGAISKVLERAGLTVTSTDLIDRGYGTGGIDFLEPPDRPALDHIITNPPYKLATEFIRHSLRCTTGKVAMLLRLLFLESQERFYLFRETPLKTVYVFSDRITCTKSGEIQGTGKGAMAYAWFVWEHGYSGKPTIEWILTKEKGEQNKR